MANNKTNNCKTCEGRCGLHGQLWIDGYHGQKTIPVTGTTAEKVAIMHAFDANISNCCVPMLQGSPDEILNIFAGGAPQCACEIPQPTIIDLFKTHLITSTSAWSTGTQDESDDIASVFFTNNVIHTTFSINGEPFTASIKDNSSASDKLKAKLTLSSLDGLATQIIQFEFLLDSGITEGKVFNASFTIGSPRFFTYKDNFFRFVLPSVVFSGDSEVFGTNPSAGAIRFVETPGLEVVSNTLFNFITCCNAPSSSQCDSTAS